MFMLIFHFFLIAVDTKSVDRKLRDVKAHLPCELLTRRRRDLGRRERLRGVIDYGGHRGRRSVSIFRAHLAFPSCQLRTRGFYGELRAKFARIPSVGAAERVFAREPPLGKFLAPCLVRVLVRGRDSQYQPIPLIGVFSLR